MDHPQTFPAEQRTRTGLATLELSVLEGSFPQKSFSSTLDMMEVRGGHVPVDLSNLLPEHFLPRLETHT